MSDALYAYSTSQFAPKTPGKDGAKWQVRSGEPFKKKASGLGGSNVALALVAAVSGYGPTIDDRTMVDISKVSYMWNEEPNLVVRYV